MKTLLGLFLLGLVSFGRSEQPEDFSLAAVSDSIKEDARLTVPELLQKYGYPSQIHKVTTDDGYILTLYRIPYGRQCGPDEKRKPPILVQHGLLCSSIDWLITGPEKGLGYILADHCYDVWLGNSRGNSESKQHTSLDIRKSKYWKFSWHEMGDQDLPAVIKYIKNVTGKPKLHYVGHSQGTTEFFTFCSIHPDICENIISMHALAPIAFMGHITSPLLKHIALFPNTIEAITKFIGLDEFLPTNDLLAKLGGKACSSRSHFFEFVCRNSLFILCGFDKDQFNTTILPAIAGHTPAGASTRQLLHYAQEINSGKFRQYDYGLWGNIAEYGSISPPDYNIEKIIAPTYLYYGQNDWMAAVEDVLQFAGKLPNLKKSHNVPSPKFNHLDFLYAIDVVPLVYNQLLENLNENN